MASGFRLFLFAVCFNICATSSSGGEPPAAGTLLQQADRCRKLLKTSVMDFYLPACLDQVNGGYLESLRGGKFTPTGEKFLTLQGRQLWFFSTLAIEGIEKEAALAAAKPGFSFLQDHMLDRTHSGYFSKVTDAGAPKDKRKHVYLNGFALYGLVAYYRATGDAAALEAAKELFRVLEQKAHDAEHGGYNEFFYDDWRPITDLREQRYVGAIGTKTYNTHMHTLEALTALYRVWPDPLVRQRLVELLVINTSTVRHHALSCNIDGWRPDWRMIETPDNMQAKYGHDIECVWLVFDTCRALDLPIALLRSWAESQCDYSLKYGFDRQNGGFYWTGPLGRPTDTTKKEWWVQAEALVSMLEMYRLTRQADYYDKFSQTLDFIEKHQVAPQGGWWATRTATGGPSGEQRTGPWQGAYHSGRALILSAKLLTDLAKQH
jgi:mannobiose 2-epimerase